MEYAHVVVHVPLASGGWRAGGEEPEREAPPPWERAFTYHVPAELQAAIGVGQLVWVPFGAQRLQGIVVGLAESTELDETRAIDAIVYPEPLLSLVQLELARRLARRYFAPLSECVWLMLPPGIEEKVETWYERVAGATAGELTPKQAAALSLLEKRPLKSTQVTPSQKSTLNTLIEQGLVSKHTAVRAARAKPKLINGVRLTTTPEIARKMIAGLDVRNAVLRALTDADAALTTDELHTLTGVNGATLQRMADEGFLRKFGDTVYYHLTESYREELPALREEQARIAVYVREFGAPTPEAELKAKFGDPGDELTALRRAGWLEREREPVRWEQVAATTGKLKPLHARWLRVLEFVVSEKQPVWVSAIYAGTDATRADLDKLAQLGLIELEQVEVVRDPLAGRTFQKVEPPALTDAQEQAWAVLRDALVKQFDGNGKRNGRGGGGKAPTFLLAGVTGSGKTEIYLNAIEQTLAQGRQAIVLVPEIALTPQTIRRFGARLGERLGVIHSGLSVGERFDTWRRIRAGEIDVVIGARAAIFAPFARLGLIVMDEEHDPSYKQTPTRVNEPSYHTREVARERARLEGAVVVLGSATPDVETYRRSEQGELERLELPRRVLAFDERGGVPHEQELPPVEIVDLRAELKQGNTSVFSRALRAALDETLARDEQAILFLNRRGSASALLCRDCGQAVKCPRCNNPFTVHRFEGREASELVCHHCGKRANVPKKCPNCGSTRIRGLGLGTEKLELQVRAEFPKARTLRWDYDVTQGKDAHERLLDLFAGGEANVLIGTQMIAKGLDLPRVTLVGAVNADSSLGLPDFRAEERTFQLLTQVAGRAGRSARAGRVIMQTYSPENYAIQRAAEHDYAGFYAREIEFRREAGYPPYRPLTRLLFEGASANEARVAAEELAAWLGTAVRRAGLLDAEVVGPAPAFFGKLRGKYRWQILLKGEGHWELLERFAVPPGWRVDVDAVEML